MEWVALKSGWLYERKPGIVLGRRWTPRWIVIYGEPVPALGIYEQRSDATPPYAPLRHLDLQPDTQISMEEGNLGKGWLKRRDSMAASIAELSGAGSDKKEPRVFTISRQGQAAIKLCFAAKTQTERDEWVGALRGLLISATIERETVPPPLVTASRVESNQHDAETISCAGVVVMEGRVVARIKAGNGSIAELNWKYQQTLSDRGKADKPRDILRLELQIRKLIGRFHFHVTRHLKRIVDEYHSGRGGGCRFEEGPLRILFIADYAQAGEEVVAGAYAWLRQEMNAVRWITSTRKAMLQQPLMTVVEYKGFRALAMLALPLGEKTLAMEASTGLMDEAAQEALQNAAQEMNLTPIPYRLGDGRVIQTGLASTIEVHRVMAPSGSPVKFKWEKQGTGVTAKTPPGLYVTNVHDLMPAYPATDELRGMMFLRREFVESLATPFIAGDASVMRILKNSRLPAVIQELDSLNQMPMDSDEWRCLLHENGLNMALLGTIATGTKLPHIREACIIEMLARTTKMVLRSRVRNAILHFRDVQALRVDEELSEVVLEVVNSVLQADPQWMAELLPTLEDRFGIKVECEEVKHLSRNALLMALQHHCALKFNESAYARPGTIELEDFSGFSMQITDGGSGCFHDHSPNPNDDKIYALAQAVLPVGESLWTMPGRRAAASRAVSQLADMKIEEKDWEGALKYVELAAGLCPRVHPQQIRISLAMTTLRCLGPANLALKPSVLGGEKSAAVNAAMGTIDELRRSKLSLLHRVERHFGPHHPLSIEVRMKLAALVEKCTEPTDAVRSEAISLRHDALMTAYKVLGRRHPYSTGLLIDLADAQRMAGNNEASIEAYTEALKLVDPISETMANLLSGLSRCNEAMGDYETSLNWATENLKIVEGDPKLLPLFESTLEHIASLSQRIFAENSNPANQEEPLAALLADDLLAEPVLAHLHQALRCYERLFDLRRTRDLNTTDSEGLLRLVRNIVLLTLRLASAPQRPALRASVRRKLFQRDSHDGDAVRELLVRMVAGPATPRETVEKVLLRAQNVDSLGEAETELALLLELVDIVQ
ncbi:hypothetical protein PSACC_03222 [Paramicrosporidium saccamoebae]|uniref:PH domain-containing protein n=1 Tax=Paramicrosporidium saccamoebae TaxID=1246581 RepID=A0A2H9TGV3_9FUNG|nr:hypothetical protein PSACC_03222 [Paramicrosporidium saccamoebae]